jgi:hypothetical protein
MAGSLASRMGFCHSYLALQTNLYLAKARLGRKDKKVQLLPWWVGHGESGNGETRL